MKIMYPEARVYEDPRLAEAQRGIWHTMTKEAIAKHFPFEAYRKNHEGLYHHRPLGGESWPDVELRIHSFLGTLHRDYGGKDVLIVAHGHWLILFRRLVERFSIEEALRMYGEAVAPNASVTIFGAGDRGRLAFKEVVTPWQIPNAAKPCRCPCHDQSSGPAAANSENCDCCSSQ